MWPPLTIGVVFTETPIYYRYTYFPKVKPPHLKSFFFLRLKVWKWFWKKFPDFKFPLILAENPPFSPDFPDWKKSSKISLNSPIFLIGGNPDSFHTTYCFLLLYFVEFFFMLLEGHQTLVLQIAFLMRQHLYVLRQFLQWIHHFQIP